MIFGDPIVLQVNGSQYSGLKSGKVTCSMETMCGEFDVEVSKPIGNDFPIKKGDNCVILIYGTPVITGFVDKLATHIESNSHTINIHGRDATCDLVDNTMPPKISFSAPTTLQSITQKVLDVFGITGMDIVIGDNVQNLEPFAANEMVASEIGETAFDFLEKYAKKKQVILNTDGLGNVLYTQASDLIVDDYININTDLQKGTVISVDMTLDDEKRFNKYTLVSQTNSAGGAGLVDSYDQQYSVAPAPSVETFTTAVATDDEIRTTRQHTFHGDSSIQDQATRQNRVNWEMNIRKANGFEYSLVVQGFYDANNNVWRPNMQINVTDNMNDVAADLLILSTTFELSVDGGTKTTLKLTTPDAFKVLTDPKTKKDKKAKKKGDEYLVDNFNEDPNASSDEGGTEDTGDY